MRQKQNASATMEEFVALAASGGHDFTVRELEEVLKESGDVFDKHGNPPKGLSKNNLYISHLIFRSS